MKFSDTWCLNVNIHLYLGWRYLLRYHFLCTQKFWHTIWMILEIEMWDLIVSVPDHCLSFYSDWLIIKDMLVFAFNLLNLLLKWVEKGSKFDLLFPNAFSDEFKTSCICLWKSWEMHPPQTVQHLGIPFLLKMQHEALFFFPLILLVTHWIQRLNVWKTP